MMDQDYGLWPLVIINSLLLIVFAGSFFHTRTQRDWRAMGAYSAFIIALLTEMYGVPLTVYLLSGWLGSRFPALRATHSGGHLWNDLVGWQGDPHVSPFHLASYAVLIAGFWLIATAWTHLLSAAKDDRLAATGPYAWVRHPQYLGFLAIMVGFLLQWPTIPTLVMFPVLVYAYGRLARAEEREVAVRYPDDWPAYAASVQRLRPRRPAVLLSTRPPAGRPGPRSTQLDPPRRRTGMRIRNRLIVATTLVAGLLSLPAGPALAATPNFGSHVRVCAQTMGFSGTDNPGMHRGAAGWDGQPCQ